MFLANFIFVVSHLKVHPCVHLKDFNGFVVIGSRVHGCANGADKNSNLRTLVTMIIMLLSLYPSILGALS